MSKNPNRLSIGMDAFDVPRWNLHEALRSAMASEGPATLERRSSDATYAHFGKSPRGVNCVATPPEVWHGPILNLGGEWRDMSIGTLGSGGYTKATDLMSPRDALMNRLVCVQAGAQVVEGLRDDVDFTGVTPATAQAVTESAAATESTPTVTKVSGAMRTVSAQFDVSRKFLQQTTMAPFLWLNITKALAVKAENYVFHGTGSNGQPTGLAALVGVNDVPGGTNGAAPSQANLIAMETAIGDESEATRAYITNSAVKGKMKATARVADTDSKRLYDIDSPLFPVNGQRCLTTGNVASNLTKGTAEETCSGLFYGAWENLVICFWNNAIEVQADPYINGATGIVRITAWLDFDAVFLRPAAFSRTLDVLTA